MTFALSQLRGHIDLLITAYLHNPKIDLSVCYYTASATICNRGTIRISFSPFIRCHYTSPSIRGEPRGKLRKDSNSPVCIHLSLSGSRENRAQSRRFVITSFPLFTYIRREEIRPRFICKIMTEYSDAPLVWHSMHYTVRQLFLERHVGNEVSLTAAIETRNSAHNYDNRFTLSH